MQTSTRFDFQKSINEIFSISEVGLVILDENREIIWINNEFERWSGENSNYWQGQNWMALPLEAADEKGDLYCLLNTERTQTLYLHHWTALLPSHPTYTVHFFKSMALTAHSSKLSQLAGSLPKRPNWIQFLDYEVSRSRRYDNPLTLFKIKLVCFQAVNDPQLEQSVNNLVESVLKDELRWADMIGHSESGETLLVLPETSQQASEALKAKLEQVISERMRQEFKNCDFELVIGAAFWQKGDSAGILLDRARDDLVAKMTALMSQYQNT
ncbi:GGDEF domain-containing protein [Pleionea litopenaei]|uniref:GGDEF domain-containing protein n=1 Tax=Pleionea litopenaei TaxID=3070815 RepID=A0AA51X5M6_9GAMM|nr:diguanylate cyclase [Pleionea sp. HL-JVS1]WMS86138.1 hypothetical protein Q9312_13005 [Pleionea sp. HL-JVS1]